MRFFFVLVIAAGVAMGIGYPWYMQHFAGTEIGSWRVDGLGEEFEPVEVVLREQDAPVRVLVEMTAPGRLQPAGSKAYLTVTAAVAGTTVLAEALTFADSTQREYAGERIYRANAGVIDPVHSGTYKFVIGRGDDEEADLGGVDLILRRNAVDPEPLLRPAGYIVVGIGLAGFLLLFKRRRRGVNKAGSRWGRGR